MAFFTLALTCCVGNGLVGRGAAAARIPGAGSEEDFAPKEHHEAADDSEKVGDHSAGPILVVEERPVEPACPYSDDGEGNNKGKHPQAIELIW